MVIQRGREPWIQTGIHLPELAPRQFHLCVARLTKRSLGDEIQRMNSPIPRRLALLATLLFSATLHAADYFPPPDKAGGWRAATTAAQARRTGRDGFGAAGAGVGVHAAWHAERRKISFGPNSTGALISRPKPSKPSATNTASTRPSAPRPGPAPTSAPQTIIF